MKKLSNVLWIVGVVLLSGCASLPTAPRRDATAALIARPDFRTAATAAPEWVREALRTITSYESELASK
jgi:tryptophan-rich sensory protein